MGCRKGASASASAPSSLSSKLLDLLHSDDAIVPSTASTAAASPWSPFPWDASAATPSSSSSSMFAMSPWVQALAPDLPSSATGLVGSLVRQEGHVYSLAAAGDLLYTGSDSRNIRVWKGRQEFSCFRSSSGLVKAIVVAGGRVFTGHQDGKIRLWRRSSKDPSVHRRVGTLPSLADFLRCALNPSNYVEVRRHRSAVWLRHFDAVSCLSFDEEAGLLYSGSWDKTIKVWRVSDSKCLESFAAHDDAVNAVAAGFDGLVFTGSADGTVKAWRREGTSGGDRGRATRHVAVQTLLRQEGAVTAVAVAAAAGAVYCGSSDGVVSYWRREGVEGRPLGRGGALLGHGMAVLCLAAAGRIVASGSADRTVRVWRREESSWAHSAVAILSGHAGPIKCLAVEAEAAAADGARYVVYSGSLDKSVNIWRVAEWERVPDSALRTPRRLRRTATGDVPSRSPLHRPGGDGGGASHV